MTTITEDDYVSFETAKLLKEKGFDGISPIMYKENGKICVNPKSVVDWRLEFWYPCLTLQAAMKWLRKVYNLSPRPRYEEVEDEKGILHYLWFFDILSMKPYKMLVEPKQGYDTYEEAAENAIKHCLKNLI